MRRNLTTLCNRLGYQFQNKALLEAALVHRSVSAENNERLEFLGDSVVNFVIAKTIYHRFPFAKEGHLSRLRANLVRGDTLAQIAKEISLGDYLVLGPGELKSGGDQRASTLADTLEAVIAAIYLDSGSDPCEAVILQLFKDRLDNVSLTKDLKDAKTQLQEYLQARKLSLPNYNIVMVDGDAHNQLFHVECIVTGCDYASTGTGTSRRRAEQAAAEQYLAWLKNIALKKQA